ncbi:MAG TPA: Crp/Fnr family transcriptional regulator [Chitinophagaceae bacterium]|nr:Crp/Fnr family transcriptional regulator [Chitinophagaceae bacterium]
MWELLHRNIERHVSIDTGEKKIIESLFRHKKYRRRQYLLQEGETCRYESFVIKGCTRTYQVDKKGQEHVLQFAPEEWWTGNMYSFLTSQPSEFNIDCIEDTEILHITRPDLEKLYGLVPKMERFFRIIIQNAFIALQKRVMTTLTQSAAERYLDFINKYPKIEQRIADKQIASYLGLTPQSLSRIRRNFKPD